MKHKYFSYSLILVLLLATSGCKKILEEQPRTSFTPSFFTTTDGLQGGIAGIYSSFRGFWGTQIFTQLFNTGTDESKRGSAADVTHWFTYNNPSIKSNTDDYLGFWNTMYIDINTANGILQYGADADIPAATKTQLLAQAKFLRGFCYFYLVTTFGQVPLHTTFNTSASAADAPAPLADVYAQIIKDFTEAAADLSPTPAANNGKIATKATALYLLAKTHLWRGWSSVAQPTDFTVAYTTAKDLIDNKATYGLNLLPFFPSVFKEGNEYSSEVLMVVDHTRDLKYGQNNSPGSGGGGAGANQSNFFWRPTYTNINANYPATGGSNMTVRDPANGRPYQRIRPNTRYVLDQAFANRATDSRYDGTFQTVWLSNSVANSVRGTTGVTTPRGTLINQVDTSIWMRDRLVTPAERAAFKGVMFEPEHLTGATVPYTTAFYPSMRKWDDSTRVDMNDYSDRPYILFRFADLYLIAAEAAFKGGGTPQQAADMINVLRTRAALKANQTPAEYAAAVLAQQVTPAQITLDFILDERSREFFAEDTRWWDLARTKKLVDRVQAWNSEGAAGVQPFNMLRPIPQTQINLVTEGPTFPQNPGYQ
ncbi:RagB/SusD family nutrient uptake outer membrane protein [Ferruginibacter sp. HRS2-29]|uniref:RagB/SusD family nutrient uptake outer membrane protein n=1 Tax=Ferruginibacter sp. HRS2-29 TaxID=2487334 RepID=UPI0020CC8762|nr:RagB/SusD family nutrient uptake outer membrane protein [Ferruginibacter sp. HRS2-29]MCP9753495.1 RagB/SusD family nutrient uptake outer membrane protein [Ferruginibacter sp. HRS2-29]